MGENAKGNGDFVGYEYKEIAAVGENASMMLDCYQCFGWLPDDNFEQTNGGAVRKLKRDRRIINKAELTRLQRNFESCMRELDGLNKAKTSTATILSLAVGIVGTAFMAGSVFAVTAEPPRILLCILFGIPGLLGWIYPKFLFDSTIRRKEKELTPLIEEKYDEIYAVCEKGNSLLYK